MKLTTESLFFVFDVESIGLHGEGFAVGYVVVNGYGNAIQQMVIACHPRDAKGDNEGREWVDKNIPAFKEGSIILCLDPKEVRDLFWGQLQIWKAKGAIIAVDCGWPVEARFLAQCVDDAPRVRQWAGPYPLHDIGSIILKAGGDPLKKHTRKENELPEHDPLNDARQSARLLIKALKLKKP